MTGSSSLKCAFIVAWLAVGCESSPEPQQTRQLTGKVTFHSRPVRIGEVLFYSPDGKHVARGTIHPDGSYRADDVILGRSKVAIHLPELPLYMKAGNRAKQLPPEMAPPKSENLKRYHKLLESIRGIPDRYRSHAKSNIVVEVKEGKEPQTFDIELAAWRRKEAG